MRPFPNSLAIVLAGLIGVAAPVANAQSIVNPALPVIPDGSFNIANYGAIGDGVTTNTAAIQAAINAANDAGGGTVEVPAGIFLSGPIRMGSSINLHLDGGAVLRMLPLDKYPGGTEAPANFITGPDCTMSSSAVRA